MSARRQQVAVVIAAVVSVAAWSSLVAGLLSVVFLGSWIGYALALVVNLPIAAFLGWRLDRQIMQELRRWEGAP